MFKFKELNKKCIIDLSSYINDFIYLETNGVILNPIIVDIIMKRIVSAACQIKLDELIRCVTDGGKDTIIHNIEVLLLHFIYGVELLDDKGYLHDDDEDDYFDFEDFFILIKSELPKYNIFNSFLHTIDVNLAIESLVMAHIVFIKTICCKVITEFLAKAVYDWLLYLKDQNVIDFFDINVLRNTLVSFDIKLEKGMYRNYDNFIHDPKFIYNFDEIKNSIFNPEYYLFEYMLNYAFIIDDKPWLSFIDS
jgi:hypothetical protein